MPVQEQQSSVCEEKRVLPQRPKNRGIEPTTGVAHRGQGRTILTPAACQGGGIGDLPHPIALQMPERIHRGCSPGRTELGQQALDWLLSVRKVDLGAVKRLELTKCPKEEKWLVRGPLPAALSRGDAGEPG